MEYVPEVNLERKLRTQTQQEIVWDICALSPSGHLPHLARFLSHLGSPALFRWPRRFLVCPASSSPTSGTNIRRLRGSAGSFSLRLFAAVTRQQRLASSVTAPYLATLCVALLGAVTSSLANSPRRGPSSWIIGEGGHKKLQPGNTESTRRGRQGPQFLLYCVKLVKNFLLPKRILPPAVAVVRPREPPFWMFGSCCRCCRRPRSCWFHSRFRAGECHSRR